MTWFLDKEFLEKLDLGGYDPAAIAEHTGVDLETVRAFVDPKRRYWVQSSDHYGWLAGANGDNKPTLLFVGKPRLASAVEHALNAVCFDLPAGKVSYHGIPLEDEEADWDTVLDAAQEAIGFQHVGNCPVLAFVHPQAWPYAVVPFPFHLHDAATGNGDAEDLDLVREWITAGDYALQCGNCYFMNAEGEVTSS